MSSWWELRVLADFLQSFKTPVNWIDLTWFKLSFSLERVFPKSYAVREEPIQVEYDYVSAKMDHYSAQVMKINGQVFKCTQCK